MRRLKMAARSQATLRLQLFVFVTERVVVFYFKDGQKKKKRKKLKREIRQCCHVHIIVKVP